MIASNIIRRAEQMADLGNSFFISYKEKEAILNDAYKQVYQQAIDAGESYFLKQITIGNNNTLPNDFYSIEEVYDMQGNIIPRMTASGLFGYEIVNDRFVLKGWNSARLVYNPKPTYLTFPGANIDTEIPSNVNIIGYHNNVYISLDGTFINIFENNLLKATIELNEEPSNVMIKDLIWVDGKVYNYNAELQYDYSNDNVQVIAGVDTLYYIDDNALKSLDGGIIRDEITGPNNTTKLIYSEYTDNCYFLTSDGHIYIEDEQITEGCNEDFALIHYDDAEFVYYNLNGKPKVISDQGITSILSKGHNHIYGTDDYLAKNNTTWYHFSPVPDTDISWPNNCYYTYLSALVAYQYLHRAEGNIQSINIKAEEDRFFDSIHRDNSQPCVIKNVYY